uniref:Protein yellow n=1 Tax=Sipha flava TaxID=143950 RepID=A0A2S2R7V0_9HEMI
MVRTISNCDAETMIIMMMSHFGLTQLFFFAAATTAIGAMEVKYSWVYVDYLFDSQQDRELAIKSGKFIQENCVILDVDVFEERVFVTVPRTKPGNIASIAELVRGTNSKSPLLRPFPNRKANLVVENHLNCDDTIVSVFRTKIDHLGRFWVLDVGTLDQFDPTARSVCPPKLLIFNLNNKDKIIRIYKFPPSQIEALSLLTNIEVDVRDSKGANTFAYISDTTAFKLIVYDYLNDDSWVVDQAYLYPYPTYTHFNVEGVTFELTDGVLGLALSPWTKNGRKLYFHSFASMRESWVDTSILQNKSLFQQGLVDGTNKFFVSPEIRKTQSSVEVMTCDGVLIYASMDSSLSCWNSRNALTIENTHEMYKNHQDFQFPTGMKIVKDKLWVVACQLQNQFSTTKPDPKSIKCRVLVDQLDGLINNAGCK